MKISAKGRYAVAIMADIAGNPGDFCSVAEIAARQGISVKCIEQIISKLVKAGMLESSRGTKGGYKLLRSPSEYSVAQILSVTGDTPKLAPCLSVSTPCPNKSTCQTIGCWETLNALIFNYLSGLTLQNLLDKTF